MWIEQQKKHDTIKQGQIETPLFMCLVKPCMEMTLVDYFIKFLEINTLRNTMNIGKAMSGIFMINLWHHVAGVGISTYSRVTTYQHARSLQNTLSFTPISRCK